MLIESDWLSLGKIAESGQCFTWNSAGGGHTYLIRHMEHSVTARQASDRHVELSCDEGEFETVWHSYFDLDTDYGEYLRVISPDDAYLRNAAEFSRGLRMLRQGFWETVVSFIVSQNNNICRIQKIMDSIIGGDASFPSPARVLQLFDERVTPAHTGYREAYIRAAAEKFLRDEPERFIHSMTSDEAYKYMLSFHGVGPKVADCIRLYALRQLDVFPRDVWVKRIEAQHYAHNGGKFPTSVYQDCCGMMQLFIFHYERHRA